MTFPTNCLWFFLGVNMNLVNGLDHHESLIAWWFLSGISCNKSTLAQFGRAWVQHPSEILIPTHFIVFSPC